MSSKTPKPALTGQRLKTRKRDEKVKVDTEGFRDDLVEGLAAAAGNDLVQASKFLETSAGDLDFRRYAEALFDVLLTGNLLAPGGTPIDDEEPSPVCVFAASDAPGLGVKQYAEMVQNVLRRLKYLEVGLEEEMKKVLKFLKAFSDENNHKLAAFTGHLLAFGLLSGKPLESLFVDVIVKEGLSLSFVTTVFQVWLKGASINSVGSVLKKAGLDSRLLEFFPPSKREFSHFEAHFKTQEGCAELISLMLDVKEEQLYKEITKELLRLFSEDEEDHSAVVAYLKEASEKNSIPEHESVALLFGALMDSVEWNKKPDQMVEQCIKLFKANVKLLGEFTKGFKAQVTLLVRIQNYCYQNQALLKTFEKIALLLYKTDVVGEDAVLDWYDKSHSQKGKSVFLEQMKKMVDWLKSAEEESEEEDD